MQSRDIRTVVTLSLLILAGLLIASKSLSAAEVGQLTGYWRDDGGGCYRVREVAGYLFWVMEDKPRVVNTFYGTIAGNVVDGEWADLPGGRLTGQGRLALRIESAERMVKISQSGNYGASTWMRVLKYCDTPPYIID